MSGIVDLLASHVPHTELNLNVVLQAGREVGREREREGGREREGEREGGREGEREGGRGRERERERGREGERGVCNLLGERTCTCT